LRAIRGDEAALYTEGSRMNWMDLLPMFASLTTMLAILGAAKWWMAREARRRVDEWLQP
jgi:hypothetical protein